jgi:hypothetical protein
MAEKIIKAAREGWFTLDRHAPGLLGSQCEECETFYFPPHHHFCRNHACQSETFLQIELSRRGRIWSYTDARYPPPPPFIAPDPYKVCVLAAVELEREKLIVLGQMTASTRLDELKIGKVVELCLETLYSDDKHDYMMWKWQPLQGPAV